MTVSFVNYYQFYRFYLELDAKQKDDELKKLSKSHASSRGSLPKTENTEPVVPPLKLGWLGARKTKHVFISGTDKGAQIIWTSKIRIVFILQLLLRLVIELVFFYLLYIIQIYQTKKTGVSVCLYIFQIHPRSNF